VEYKYWMRNVWNEATNQVDEEQQSLRLVFDVYKRKKLGEIITIDCRFHLCFLVRIPVKQNGWLFDHFPSGWGYPHRSPTGITEVIPNCPVEPCNAIAEAMLFAFNPCFRPEHVKGRSDGLPRSCLTVTDP
jgi:hypothetical protein